MVGRGLRSSGVSLCEQRDDGGLQLVDLTSNSTLVVVRKCPDGFCSGDEDTEVRLWETVQAGGVIQIRLRMRYD